MVSAKRLSTLIDSGQEFATETKIKLPEIYREVADALLYLMVETRSDIAYAIGMLAKFVETQTDTHWKALQKAIRYLIYSRNLGLIFDGAHPATPNRYNDSDGAEDRKN